MFFPNWQFSSLPIEFQLPLLAGARFLDGWPLLDRPDVTRVVRYPGADDTKLFLCLWQSEKRRRGCWFLRSICSHMGNHKNVPLYLAPACPTKVTLGSKGLPGTNALANFSRLSGTAMEKSFISLTSARRRCLQGNARFPAGADKNVQVKSSTLKENLIRHNKKDICQPVNCSCFIAVAVST